MRKLKVLRWSLNVQIWLQFDSDSSQFYVRAITQSDPNRHLNKLHIYAVKIIKKKNKIINRIALFGLVHQFLNRPLRFVSVQPLGFLVDLPQITSLDSKSKAMATIFDVRKNRVDCAICVWQLFLDLDLSFIFKQTNSR